MIQFNLLPDVKIQYLKARRTKQLVISSCVIAMGVALFILLLLLATVHVFQRKNLSDLNKDISTYRSQLQSTNDINKILTVQNQLQSLPALHNQKPVATRLFGYLTQTTPSEATISQLTVDFSLKTLTITGAAPSLDMVNTHVDTLKFTTYKQVDGTSAKAFPSVVLSQFSRNNSGATYTVAVTFAPAIFDSANTIKLTVPNIISTRSAVEKPTDLFQDNANSGGQ